MFRSEQQKMRLYKANLKKEAVNDFKQGEALDEYLLYEKGIESQKTGLSKFAAAIGEAVGENLGAREVKPVDKIKQWSAQTVKDDWTTQTASNPALDANIVARSKKMPKSIKQPAGPKPVVSTLSNLSAADDLALRERFLTVLNDMKSSVESTAKEKAEYAKLAKLVERNRLENAISQYGDWEIANLDKIKRNLGQLVANKTTNLVVAAMTKHNAQIRAISEKPDLNRKNAFRNERRNVRKLNIELEKIAIPGEPAPIFYSGVQAYKQRQHKK